MCAQNLREINILFEWNISGIFYLHVAFIFLFSVIASLKKPTFLGDTLVDKDKDEAYYQGYKNHSKNHPQQELS
jgi:hypothetical protein